MKRPVAVLVCAFLFGLSLCPCLSGFGAAAAQTASESTARNLLAAAEQKRLSEDWYGAVENYLAALQKNPAYVDAMLGLAECYYEVGEYQQSLVYIQKATPYKRSDAALQNLEGFVRIGLADLNGARRCFSAVAASRPNDLDARFGLALLDLAGGKKTDARVRLEDSLHVSPQNARALLSLALIAEDQGRRSESEALIERALRYHGEDAKVQYTAARLAAKSGDLQNAVFYARNALNASPGYADARRLLARLMYDSASYDEAASLMREAVAQNRKDYLSWFTLGLATEAGGRKSDAVYAFRQALAIRPDDEMSRVALENVIMDGSALEDSSREEYANWHFARGSQFENRNYFEQALFEYRRGLRVYPYSKQGRVLYANLLKKRGLPGAQLAELQLLKDLGKADTPVLDAIETYSSLLEDSLSAAWKIDQYSLEKRPYKVALFYTASSGSEFHPSSTALVLRYVGDILSSSSRLSILKLDSRAANFTDAFRRAREAGADYFLIVATKETERDIEISCDMRVARTGSVANSFGAYRSGNDRLKDAASRIAGLLVASLQPKGSLLRRSNEVGLVDLGRSDGFKNGDKFLVIRGGELAVAPEGLGPSYLKDAVVGRFTITRTDEELCEGKLEPADFFDRVNVGDELIPAPDEKKQAAAPKGESRPAAAADSALLDQVRALR